VANEPPPVTQPTRLQIPSLNLDQPITVVPIREGLWDLDRLGAQVGWLTATGAYPEDKWAMVLVGHITLTTLERGAFADLEEIKKGAIVTYHVNEMEYVYEVREKRRVAPEDVEALYVPDGKVLLLMTCTDFDHLDRTYANRLLVRAELIEKRALTP
jgi:LPXTG-site transpeptidase (sortase) family protein